MNKQIKPYIISVAIALGVGALSALFTRNNMDIYSEVATPPLSPPAILFPLVWTLLYILMGISAAAIYTSHSASVSQRKRALYTYAASLVVNFFWSIIFFNMRAFALAFIWLLLLLYLIIKTILQYKEIEPTAAYLQIPYALWVAFAGYLNFGIWYLNR
ncbi:MAG: TspO/MBR family protein [Acutalibacteraceae bacterium]|nr:TspO/MBR family protein [Acutalibacteraceae bacterium]